MARKNKTKQKKQLVNNHKFIAQGLYCTYIFPTGMLKLCLKFASVDCCNARILSVSFIMQVSICADKFCIRIVLCVCMERKTGIVYASAT